ncbi:MAG: hypothetical protein ABIP32_07000 [Chthoniobacterales bacterium]
MVEKSYTPMPPGTTSNTIYSGTFERSIDAKNRVTIPSRWLAEEEEEFYSVVNPRDHFLILMPPGEFANVENSLIEQGIPAAERRPFIRQFYGNSQIVTADKQGRILLPVDHCSRTGLKDNVVIIGSKSRFEIWSAERWAAAKSEETTTYQKVADLIGL